MNPKWKMKLYWVADGLLRLVICALLTVGVLAFAQVFA